MNDQQQQKKQPVKWIVPLPENDPFGRASFTAACRGNADMGDVLNYFTYEASREAGWKNIDPASVEYITIDRTQDKILPRVNVSVKTLISYIKQFGAWGFLIPHGYHHCYDVCFKKIAEAIRNPPVPEKRKSRGRNILKSTNSTNSTNHQEDGTDLPVCSFEQFVNLQTQMVNLQTRIVVLETTMVNLQSEMVKLQSLQSSEGALNQAFVAKNDAPKNLDSNENLQESTREREGAAFADATPAPDHSHENVTAVSDSHMTTGNIIPPRLTLSAKGVSSNGVLVGDREGQLDRDRGADGAVFPVAAVGRQDVSLARAQVGSPTDCREASAPMEAATQHTPVRASPSSLSLSSCDAPSTAHSHTVGDPLPIVPSLPAKAPERGDWEASGEPPDTVAAGRSRTGEKPRRGKPPAKSDEALPSLTEDELAFWNEWCSQFKTAPPLGPKTIEAVKRMRAPVTTWAGVLGVERAALMKDIRLWIHAQDKKKFYSRGIRFTDFDREFENWQEAKQFEIDLNTPPDSYADNDYSLPAQLWRQEQRFREQPDSLSILLGARVPPLMEVP